MTVAVKMDATGNTTEWCQIGTFERMQFIGKEAMFIGCGCNLYFMNLKTNEMRFYTANNGRSGDGIKNFVGHRFLNYFAFAEACGNPNIFVMSYPDFETISVLEGGSKEGFISLAFSETSIFVSLGTLPHFTITVWNWRRGERLGSSKSHICRQYQTISCNIAAPVRVAQLGDLTNNLHVWDVLLCGKKCIMTHHKVKMPAERPDGLGHCLWSADGALYALDRTGHVYQVNSEHVLERIIQSTSSGNLNMNFVFYKGDFIISGPNLELRFYRKSGSAWTQYKSMVPPESITTLECSKADILIGRSDRSFLIQISPEEEKFSFVFTDESEFDDFCLLYPVGRYVCLMCHHNLICTIEIITGKTVSKYDLMGTALSLGSNPEFPYVGIGYSNGLFELISFYDPAKPVSMTHFKLTQNPISSVYFSEFGRVMVAADLASGEFFVLEGIPGGTINVVATVHADRQIVDYILVPSTNCYRLFVIPVTSNDFIVGNKIIRYCILSKHNINVKEYRFKDPKTYYFQICSTAKINRDRVFFAVPYNAKSVHEIEVRRGDNFARVLRTINTGHQIRKNSLYMDKYHAITWSYDGFVIARCADFERFVGVALPHHRLFGGVKKARIDPSGKYVVTLGHEQNFVCTNLVDNELDVAQQEELEALLSSQRYSLLFKRKTVGFEPTGSIKDYSWLEYDLKRQAELDRKRHADERESLLVEFADVQGKLRALLEANVAGPENERLELHEFNLDARRFEELKEANRVECKETDAYIRKYIAAQRRVCEALQDLCWRPMAVRKRKLVGICDNTNVENYSLLPPDGARTERLGLVCEQLRLEGYAVASDKFEPWRPVSFNARSELFAQTPQFHKLGANLESELDEETDSQTADRDTAIAMAGSTAINFVKVSPDRYSQFEMQTFYQLTLLTPIIELDIDRLKEYFNKEFEAMYQLKEREISSIRERNARMRHIVDEINYFSQEQMYVHVKDPSFAPGEQPERIHEVLDSEVPIGPYVSPSEQAILDAKAAEEERIRLLLLADDFRERALQAMMNGVLEIRWEDELKKDVPMPKCMVEKEPEDFNEDDLRAVKDYEDKVKFLASERERYKNLLDQEYSKIGQQVREGVFKFNKRLASLLETKIRVDAAIAQENLILSKDRVKLLDRIKHNDKELDLKRIMVANEELIQGVQQLLASLQDAVQDCKNNVEAMQNKDKFLEKAFKKDVAEFPAAAQEIAAKLLKRRPKGSYKAIVSTTLLQALSRAVVGDASAAPLVATAECRDYLRALDRLDEPVGAPIDDACYRAVCRHRRLRVEQEIRVRAAQATAQEADATIAALQRRLQQKREQNVRFMAELAQVRTDRLRAARNQRVQIVIKQGLVEVPMLGNVADFRDALLVPRQEVEQINRLILENGRIKLNAMRHTMSFHREIMKTEWLHRKLRMHLEDLREQINDINEMKLTKEMQTYLKGREKALPFEMEVEIAKQSYENIISEMKSQVAKLRKQIRALRDASRKLDGEIADVNVDVCEYKLDKDYELEEEAKKVDAYRITMLAKRGKLVREIQENHNTMLLMQTELELLRLKTYPTLKYRILDE